MTNFPPDDNEKHNPKFIYLNKGHFEEIEVENAEFEGKQEEPFQNVANEKYPLVVRAIFFMIFSLLLFFAASALLIVGIFFLVNVLTFFKLEHLKARTAKLWLYTRILCVLALGMGIAVFSPRFGFGTIMLYLSLIGAKQEKDWVSRMMKDRFHQS